MIGVDQQLCEALHLQRYLPHWVNTLQFTKTCESFGVVPICNMQPQFSEAVREAAKKKGFLTRDLSYYARRIGWDLPPTPVQGQEEHKTYGQLIRKHMNGNAVDFEKMAAEWNQHVDGIGIFPKLPVNLRLHLKDWQRSTRIKDAMEHQETALADLKKQMQGEGVSHACMFHTGWQACTLACLHTRSTAHCHVSTLAPCMLARWNAGTLESWHTGAGTLA